MSHQSFVEPHGQTTTLLEECPLTVREAAKFLGVSPQTVYLWVERKQIPHLRVMGQYPVPQIGSRNIPRVLQTGDGECLDHECTTVLSFGERKAGSGGFVIGTGTAFVDGSQH